ncbi:response regulator [Caulobacter sp. UNC279MFTsu5.1]|uniref:response regulator n=1 Tax=Caulobacter sp. UNC279MFTsu5.1 TaxID=1502775 RepID=UPI000363A028|nr:response regulator [Caulobacter sp. UNC279MFTsu5.1]SFJ29728.1 Response regulator receiver domain-containing protein [Caulobacter sp. UNC279MFTsu5.1]
MRILFVEDNQMNRRVVAEMLRAGGVEMDEAEDGPSGLAMIDANAYDLVLMDLRMPGMDGLTAIREIRARADAKARLPVIVVTADSGSALDADCQAAGADDVIRKPVDLATLFTTIGDLIARRGDGGLVLN